VTVTPAEGNEVKISVKRAGQSSVQVTTPGVSKELAIKAESQNNVLRFEITQREAKRVAEAAAPGAPGFDSEKEKRSYALGENLGLNIRRQSVEVDAALVVEGFKDGLAGSGMRLGEDDVRAVVGALEKELLTNMVAAAGEKNKKEGEAFLADNKSREGVVALESGLQYKVLKAGDGKKPTLDDTVVCKYRGTLIDGKEFDTSDKRGKPGEFPLKRVIKGWAEALQLMPVGSKWQLFIPPELAYGARGNTGGIGPNATLIFEVELVSIKAPSAKNVRAAEADDGEKAAGQEH
jgi:FKBP-type peptidyl-prolyl cis-trans isomerase FklB